jgi:hypothetical protein
VLDEVGSAAMFGLLPRASAIGERAGFDDDGCDAPSYIEISRSAVCFAHSNELGSARPFHRHGTTR